MSLTIGIFWFYLFSILKKKKSLIQSLPKKKVLENDDEVWKSPGKVLKFDVDQRVDTMPPGPWHLYFSELLQFWMEIDENECTL